MLSDLLCSGGALAVFNILRYYQLSYLHYSVLGHFLEATVPVLEQIFFPLIVVGVVCLSGFYHEVLHRPRVWMMLNCAAVTLAATVLFYFIALIGDSGRNTSYLLMLQLWGLLLIAMGCGRMALSACYRRRIMREGMRVPVMLIGKIGDIPLRSTHAALDTYRMKFVCELDSNDVISDGLDALVGRHKPEAFLIASGDLRGDGMMAVVGRLLHYELPIYVCPDTFMILTGGAKMSAGVPEPLIDVSRTRMSAFTCNVKRIVDIIVAAAGIALLWPFVAAMALIVVCDSPGRALYCQMRVGRHGKPFTIYKLRTMYRDAERMGVSLSRSDDPRVTRVGRFLRKYRIDELPQLWNVLRGDMSLVGPRPEREYYMRQIVARAPHALILHQVRPGLTSWGMVKYGYASTVDEMLQRLPYDLLYLDNMSLATDIMVMIQSIKIILSGKGV